MADVIDAEVLSRCYRAMQAHRGGGPITLHEFMPPTAKKEGKTSVLSAEEMRIVLDSIDVSKISGLRDRALIGLMGYTFARVGAVIGLKAEDYYIQKGRGWIRLHEKGGKVTELSSGKSVRRHGLDTTTIETHPVTVSWQFDHAGDPDVLEACRTGLAVVERVIASRDAMRFDSSI